MVPFDKPHIALDLVGYSWVCRWSSFASLAGYGTPTSTFLHPRYLPNCLWMHKRLAFASTGRKVLSLNKPHRMPGKRSSIVAAQMLQLDMTAIERISGCH
jgi:hypothetical protein